MDPVRTLESLGDRLAWRPPPFRPWLLATVALGVAGDLLLRAAAGLNLALWLVALLVAGVAVSRIRGPLGRERSAVVGLGILAASVVAVRSNPPLQVLATGMVAVSIGWSLVQRPWTDGLVTRLVALLGAGVSAVALAPLRVAATARSTEETQASSRVAVIARGTLVATPILLVVGALFVAGDPVFARYADRLLRLGLDRVLSHLALALLLAWIAGGLVLAMAGVRVGDLAPAPGPWRRWAGEVTVVLRLVDVLFAAFLAVQARALFGGRTFVEATVGMTYAEYARSGFFQLVVAAAIAIPIALGAEWVLGSGSRARPTSRAAVYGLAGGVVLVLASAAHRLGLYVETYGLTEARVYAAAFMAWVALSAVWLVATIARGRTERFAPGALVAAWGVFAVLAVVDPAATVVRVNAARAAAGETPGFDVQYGTSALGTDAIPALVDALDRLAPDERCAVAVHLLEWRDRHAGGDWRSWTVSRWRARRALASREEAIRELAAPCNPVEL